MGYTCGLVEKWNAFAKVKQDLFGFIDIVAINGKEILGVQCTSLGGHSARKTKILKSPLAPIWINSGARVQVWGWKKTGNKWETKIEEIFADGRSTILIAVKNRTTKEAT